MDFLLGESGAFYLTVKIICFEGAQCKIVLLIIISRSKIINSNNIGYIIYIIINIG